VFVKDRGHTLGSDVSLKPQGGKDLVGLRAGNLMSVRHGGGGALTRFVCGYVACDKRICQPLIGCLPPMFSVGIGADSTSAWLTHLLQVGVQESLAQRPGARSLLAKISELLFVEAMRRYAASLPSEQKGWLAGLRDPYVGKAVGRLHADVARAWTLDVLASEVGLSRSALSERFSDLIGEAPMQYLTRWRMALAARALRTQSDLIARVAERCGYESEAAFNRAFKREFGAPPAAWRRLEQRGSGIVSGSADSSSVC
jgi:AraC-like DNA-binding protein